VSIMAETEQFVRLLTDSQSRLYAYILTLVPDFTAANDVLSETNTTLWRKSSDFQVDTNFAAWAVRIAYFEVLAYQKRRRADPHLFEGDLLDEVAAAATAVAEDFNEKRQALRSCVEKLPSKDHQLVDLRYQRGLSVQEIAQRRGKTANAVSQALFRIRAALAACIERTLHLEASG
jgi:RNA polymerase sigma-70 factor, ECF subfamily